MKGQPWERQRKETARSYQAFVIYRDLGARRTLRRAWEIDRATHPDPGMRKASKEAEPPGCWTDWQKRYKWTERARAWDLHANKIADEARLERIAELARKRVDFEFEEVDLAQNLARRTYDAALKLLNYPPVTVTKTLPDGTEVEMLGLNPTATAAFLRAVRDVTVHAVQGPRMPTSREEVSRDNAVRDAAAVEEELARLTSAELRHHAGAWPRPKVIRAGHRKALAGDHG